jgi:hypothetical protein
MLYLYGEKVCICGVAEVFSLQKSLDPQIANLHITNPQITTMIGLKNRKFAKCHICERSAKLTNCFKSATCGFAICGTYLRPFQMRYNWRKSTVTEMIITRGFIEKFENLQRTYKKYFIFWIQHFPSRGTVPGTIGVRQYSYKIVAWSYLPAYFMIGLRTVTFLVYLSPAA